MSIVLKGVKGLIAESDPNYLLGYSLSTMGSAIDRLKKIKGKDPGDKVSIDLAIECLQKSYEYVNFHARRG